VFICKYFLLSVLKQYEKKQLINNNKMTRVMFKSVAEHSVKIVIGCLGILACSCC